MSLLDLLKRAAQLKSGLDNLRPIDREQEARIMQKFRLDWNYHSNHLEGNSLTYGETKALILFGITAQGKPLKDHIEMTGHDEAVKWIEDVVKEERPLTEIFIRELNLLVLKESSYGKAQTPAGQPTTKLKVPGQYKTQPNHVLTVTGEMFYFASPEETPAKMHDLLEWFRGKKNDAEMNPVLLAAEFHYKIIRIHPFDDGNGRTARILMNFILMQHGYPPVVIKTDDKQHYIAALRQADAGLLEPFMEYIADNLIHSLELMVKGAKGENIDEPDDLDKEIALLEQKLRGFAGIEINRTNDIVLDIFDKSLVKLLSSFLEKAKKLEKLYKRSTLFVSLHEQYEADKTEEYFRIRNGNLVNLRDRNFVEKIRNKLEKPRTLTVEAGPFEDETSEVEVPIEEIIIGGIFSRNTTFENFNYKSTITINLEHTGYSFSTHDKSITIRKYYSEQLSDEEISQIIETETRRHLEAIEAKIKEIQTPK